MRKIAWRILLIIVLFLPGVLFAELKKIVLIGSNDINYLFFNVAAASLGDHGDFFVLDSKGFFIRKYDGQGVFIKEIGRQGQGPGEFSNVLSGMCLDQDIYILDSGNGRIVDVDQGLKIKGSLRVERQGRTLAKLGDSFYMIASKPGGPFSEIIRCGEQGGLKTAFFDERPSFMGGTPPTGMDLAMWKMYADLTMAADRDSGEIIVTFKYPGSACEMLIYDENGHFLRLIKVGHPIRYDFPDFRLRWPVDFPDRSQLLSLGSAHFMEAHKLLLERWIEDYESNRTVGRQKELIVLDTALGTVIHRERLDSSIEIMDAKGDLICARQEDGDLEKVAVYRLVY
jgi:hypothetical protein